MALRLDVNKRCLSIKGNMLSGVNIICKQCLDECKQYKQITLLRCPFFNNEYGVRGYRMGKRKATRKDTPGKDRVLERLTA